MGEAVGPLQAAVEPVGTGNQAVEQRSAARYMPLIRTAKLVFEKGEYLCVVRDASATGVSVRLFHAVPADKMVTLELQNGDRHLLERVWDEGEWIGFRFTDEIDVNRLLAAHGEHPKRPVRLGLESAAEITTIAGREPVVIRNLSQQGALVECERLLALSQRVRLSSRYIPELRATVRWRGDNLYGLVFEDTFQFAELARITARIQGIDTFYNVA